MTKSHSGKKVHIRQNETLLDKKFATIEMFVNSVIRMLCHFTKACSSVKSFEATCCKDIPILVIMKFIQMNGVIKGSICKYT